MNWKVLAISSLFAFGVAALMRSPREHKTVAIGDSHLEAMRTHLDSNYTVIAANGLTFRGASKLKIPKAKAYLFVLGTNDVHARFDEAVFRRHIADLVTKCPKEADISFLQVPWHIHNSFKANKVLAEFGTVRGFPPFWMINEAEDGIHFTLQSYKTIAAWL